MVELDSSDAAIRSTPMHEAVKENRRRENTCQRHVILDTRLST